MAFLKFLFGKNLTKSSAASTFEPGTLYLDVETKELYFDNPSATSGSHAKIVDTSTLIYMVDEEVEVDLA
jgi:hypothetical protein